MNGIEPALYWDIQREKAAAFCPHCLGELYPPSLSCLRCERRRP